MWRFWSREIIFIIKRGVFWCIRRRGESERRKETSANILHECFYRLFWDEALSSALLRSAMDSICVDSLSIGTCKISVEQIRRLGELGVR